MNIKPIVFVISFGILIGLLVSLASRFDTTRLPSNPEELVANAIEADLEEYLDVLPFEDEDGTLIEALPVCMEVEQAIDFPALNRILEDRRLVTYDKSLCTFERQSADGMFAYVDRYFDPHGGHAAKLKLKYSCTTPRSCGVDIDHHTGGWTFLFEKQDGQWHLQDRQLRWVV